MSVSGKRKMQTLQIYPHSAFVKKKNCNIFKMADLEKAVVCVCVCLVLFSSIALIYFVFYSRDSMGVGTHNCLYSDII